MSKLAASISRLGRKDKPISPKLRPEHQWLPPRALPDLAIGLGLIVSIFLVYAQVGHFDFINYDDDLYVYDNAHVQAGLTPASIKWAFTAVVSNNWMPVTLLSHILDGQFFHMRERDAPSGECLVPRAVGRAAVRGVSACHRVRDGPAHLSPSCLRCTRCTSNRWPGLRSAKTFSAHSSSFWRSTAMCATPNGRAWAVTWLVVASFCLGLMSKPMLVTFPFTLLLFDFWPLRRRAMAEDPLGEAPAARAFRRRLRGDLFGSTVDRMPSRQSRSRRGWRTP